MRVSISGCAAISVLAVFLGGCGPVPVVSDAKTWGHSTLNEQRAWATREVDAVTELIGIHDGWRWGWHPGSPWPEERESILEAIGTESCRPSREASDHQPGRLVLSLNRGPVPAPFEAAERVREHWVAEGWEVRDVEPPEMTDGVLSSVHFRADREDGAGLALSAAELLLTLDVLSSCSDDSSVVYRHVDS